MKPVFCILAVVSLTATSDAALKLLEYHETEYDNFYRIFKFEPSSVPSRATPININLRVTFERKGRHASRSVNFRPVSYPEMTDLNLGFPDEHCEFTLGLYVEEINRYFCNITDIFIGAFPDKNASGEPRISIGMSLMFRMIGIGQILLIVPVFNMPTEVASKTPEELLDWGRENRVEIFGPLTEENLSRVLLNSPIQIKFDWLERLLRHGIVRRLNPSHERELTYATRGMVISTHVYEKILRVLAYYKYPRIIM